VDTETETTAAEPVGDRLDEDLPLEELLDGELLVEEVSIDGMCGVY
jgi:mycofactocin precursor